MTSIGEHSSVPGDASIYSDRSESELPKAQVETSNKVGLIKGCLKEKLSPIQAKISSGEITEHVKEYAQDAGHLAADLLERLLSRVKTCQKQFPTSTDEAQKTSQSDDVFSKHRLKPLPITPELAARIDKLDPQQKTALDKLKKKNPETDFKTLVTIVERHFATPSGEASANKTEREKEFEMAKEKFKESFDSGEPSPSEKTPKPKEIQAEINKMKINAPVEHRAVYEMLTKGNGNTLEAAYQKGGEAGVKMTVALVAMYLSHTSLNTSFTSQRELFQDQEIQAEQTFEGFINDLQSRMDESTDQNKINLREKLAIITHLLAEKTEGIENIDIRLPH